MQSALRRIDCDLITPPPFALILNSLLTDEYLHIIRRDGVVDKNVWAIGDAAVIKDGLLPATAQGEPSFANFSPTVQLTLIIHSCPAKS